MHAEDDPALHVEHAGPGRPTVGDAERTGGERADRVHGVVVADEQDPRLARPAPVDVRTGDALDQRRPRAEPALDERRRRQPPTWTRRRRRATATRPRPAGAGRRARRRAGCCSRGHGTARSDRVPPRLAPEYARTARPALRANRLTAARGAAGRRRAGRRRRRRPRERRARRARRTSMSASSSRAAPLATHHEMKPAVNASPAPIVSTTGTVSTGDHRRTRWRRRSSCPRPRRSRARPAWSQRHQLAARPPGQPGEVLVARLDDVGSGQHAIEPGHVRRRDRRSPPGRQLRSTTTSTSRSLPATMRSIAVAIGSSTSPSPPVTRAAASGGSAAGAAASRSSRRGRSGTSPRRRRRSRRRPASSVGRCAGRAPSTPALGEPAASSSPKPSEDMRRHQTPSRRRAGRSREPRCTGAPPGTARICVGRDDEVDQRLPGNDDHERMHRVVPVGYRQMDGDSMDTPSDAVRRLQAEGYTGNWFANRDHELECDETSDSLRPADLEIDHILRFEGQSDPGDMTICSPCAHRRATKGVYSRPVRRPHAGRGRRRHRQRCRTRPATARWTARRPRPRR